jgi:hypothetical protein
MAAYAILTMQLSKYLMMHAKNVAVGLFEQPIAEITCQRENTVTSRFYYETKQ